MAQPMYAHRLIFTSIKRFVGCNVPQSAHPRTLRQYMLARITTGKAIVVIDQVPHQIQAMDWLLLAPGSTIRYYTDSEQTCLLEGLLFRPQYIQQSADKTWRSVTPPLRINYSLNADSLPPSVDDLWKLIHGRHTDTLHRHDILRRLLNDMQQVSQDTSKHGLSHALLYLQQHYDADIRIKDIAHQSGFSLNHFIRVFKQHFKQTPGQYLQHIRIQKAKQLLLGTSKIKDIAHLTGFRDEHYFSRAFKKSVGTAPGLYLKRGHVRIATRYYGLDDYLMTLGIQPLTRLSYNERVAHWHVIPDMERLYTQAVTLSSTQLNYEHLRQLEPDVILTSDRLAPESELEEIAPTSIIPYSPDPEATIRNLAQVFGQEQAAVRWLACYEAERTRSQHFIKERWGSPRSAFLRILPHGYRLYGPKSQVGHLLYQLLNCELPPILQAQDWAIELTPDQLASSAIDHLFIMTDPVPQARHLCAQLLKSKQWHRFPAARLGRIYPADDLFFKTLGPSGMCWSMDFAVRQFAK